MNLFFAEVYRDKLIIFDNGTVPFPPVRTLLLAAFCQVPRLVFSPSPSLVSRRHSARALPCPNFINLVNTHLFVPQLERFDFISHYSRSLWQNVFISGASPPKNSFLTGAPKLASSPHHPWPSLSPPFSALHLNPHSSPPSSPSNLCSDHLPLRLSASWHHEETAAPLTRPSTSRLNTTDACKGAWRLDSHTTSAQAQQRAYPGTGQAPLVRVSRSTAFPPWVWRFC